MPGFSTLSALSAIATRQTQPNLVPARAAAEH